MAKIYIFHCILAHDDRNYCYGKVFYGGIFFENDKVYKVCKVLVYMEVLLDKVVEGKLLFLLLLLLLLLLWS
jgi:hypothetical protein